MEEGTESPHQQLLKSLKTALESCDADEAASHYAEDALFIDATAGEQASIRGREGLRSMFRKMFSTPDAKFEVTSAFGCSGWAGAEWTWSGTNPQDNRRFRFVGASILQIRDDKVVRETVYYVSK